MLTRGRLRATRGSVVACVLAGVMTVSSAIPALALPPEPVNPSDQQIETAQGEASGSAAEVGRLAAEIAMTENQIGQIQADLQLKQELVKKAILDVDVAAAEAVSAQQDAEAAEAAVVTAGDDITAAEVAAAEFAAASYRQGSTVGGITTYWDVQDLQDLLDRQQLITQVSGDQNSVLENLRRAQIDKANLQSDAKVERDAAVAAKAYAEQVKIEAEQAQQETVAALDEGQASIVTLQTTLAAKEAAYGAALENVDSLQGQRVAWVQWQADKKAEDERLAAEAAAAEKARIAEAAAAKAAADAKAKSEADKVALLARLTAAADDAQRQAVIEQEIADRAVADTAAQQKAAEAQAAAVAAAQAAEEADAAGKAAADKAAADAQAAAETAAAESAAATAEIQAAQEALAIAEAEAKRIADIEGSVYYASCADVQTAGKTTINKGEAGYRVALDRNTNGIACEVLPDSAAIWAANNPTGPATEPPGQEAPAPTAEQVEASVYYPSCAEALQAGVAPIAKGSPGYRSGLDRNANGFACEVLPDSEAAWNAANGVPPAPAPAPAPAPVDDNIQSVDPGPDNGRATPRADFQVPRGTWTAERGQAAVAAGLSQVGVPYSWGGGNLNGPTTGICSGGAAWNDCNIVGFDCSGFTSWAWAKAGIRLPPLTHYQWTKGQRISVDDMLPGDLIFYARNTNDPSSIHHVTMYIGEGQAVDSPQSGAHVRVAPVKRTGVIGVIRPGT